MVLTGQVETVEGPDPALPRIAESAQPFGRFERDHIHCRCDEWTNGCHRALRRPLMPECGLCTGLRISVAPQPDGQAMPASGLGRLEHRPAPDFRAERLRQ